MFSEENKDRFFKIIPFSLIWLAFGVIYSLLEKGILADLKVYPATGTIYSFSKSFPLSALGSFVMGLLVGTLEVRYLNHLFKKMSFGSKLFFKTIIYVAFIIFFLLVLSVSINSAILNLPVYNASVLQAVEYFIIDFAFWSVVLYIGAIVIVSLFFLEVSENLGQNVLKNFVFGKYHKPIQETRIFMFLDMKSSTTIAEKLGHTRYFNLLKMYYAEMRRAIINSKGEIYQYVGDEIVISWPLVAGLKNRNCLECFFKIKKAFDKNAQKFQADFGVVPYFKAALHYGNVTTGEIGEIKKEILFTGDVLNTTARIQGLCNTFNEELLISGSLLSKLGTLASNYQIKNHGDQSLKGKDIKVELFGIRDI